MFNKRDGEFYLAVKAHPKWSGSLNARLTNKLPKLEAGEVAIKLSISVPDALFRRPQLQASITVPEDAVSNPVISAAVLDNIKEVLTQQTGLDIKLVVIEPTEVD